MPTILGVKYPDKLVEYNQELPTSAADVTTVTTYVKTIHLSNTTAGALTVTFVDGQGTPLEPLKAYSIAANTPVTLNFDLPLKFQDGLNVVASGAGVDAYIAGWRIGE